MFGFDFLCRLQFFESKIRELEEERSLLMVRATVAEEQINQKKIHMKELVGTYQGRILALRRELDEQKSFAPPSRDTAQDVTASAPNFNSTGNHSNHSGNQSYHSGRGSAAAASLDQTRKIPSAASDAAAAAADAKPPSKPPTPEKTPSQSGSASAQAPVTTADDAAPAQQDEPKPATPENYENVAAEDPAPAAAPATDEPAPAEAAPQ